MDVQLSIVVVLSTRIFLFGIIFAVFNIGAMTNAEYQITQTIATPGGAFTYTNNGNIENQAFAGMGQSFTFNSVGNGGTQSYAGPDGAYTVIDDDNGNQIYAGPGGTFIKNGNNIISSTTSSNIIKTGNRVISMGPDGIYMS